jgi:hypothetical protein
MKEPTNTQQASYLGSRRLLILVLTGVLIAFSIELYSFARTQDVWVDESTQLSGITLKPWEMLRWLSGWDLDRFGVPGDRMPPISYLFDWLWLRFSGPSEVGFRLFHSGLVIIGVLVLTVIALKHLGPTAATVTLLFLVLSPKLIQTGVEIRAYPLFFAVSCLQLAIFLQLVPNSRQDAITVNPKLLAIFGLCCLIAIYIHFYGLISTGAFFLALGLGFFRSSNSLTILAVAFILVLVGSIGLIPFVTSAVGQSAPMMLKERAFSDYVTYLLRLFGDSANIVLLPAAILFLGGSVALLVSGAIPAFRRIRNRTAQSIDWLYIVVFAGAFAPIFASLVISRFNVLSANYSGWIFAPVALLIGAGASAITGYRFWDKLGRLAAASATLIGALGSTIFFFGNSSMFVHGPQRFVSAIFNETKDPKAIVYEASSAWGFSYFPLVYTHGGKIHQYRLSDGQIEVIVPRNAEAAINKSVSQDIRLRFAPYDHLLLVNTELRSYRDLRECRRLVTACPSFGRGVVEDLLIETGQWREAQVERNFGIYDTQVTILDRIAEENASPRGR